MIGLTALLSLFCVVDAPDNQLISVVVCMSESTAKVAAYSVWKSWQGQYSKRQVLRLGSLFVGVKTNGVRPVPDITPQEAAPLALVG